MVGTVVFAEIQYVHGMLLVAGDGCMVNLPESHAGGAAVCGPLWDGAPGDLDSEGRVWEACRPAQGFTFCRLRSGCPPGISLAYHMTGRKVKQNGKKAMEYLREQGYDRNIKEHSAAPKPQEAKRRRGNEVQAK